MHGRNRHPAADHMHQSQGTTAASASAAELATDAAVKKELNVLLCQLHNRDDHQQLLQAARGIGQFAMQGPDHQASAAAAGSIAALVNLLKNTTNTQLQGYCSLALGSLALRNSAIQTAVAEAGAVALLADLVANSSSNEARSCAVLALASLAWHNSIIATSIAAEGAIHHIIQLFDSTDVAEIHGHAAQALGNLAAAHSAAAVDVIAAGGVTCLTQLLRSQCSSVAAKEKALKALWILISLDASCSTTATAAEDIMPVVVKLALDHSRNNGSNSARSSRSQSSTGSCIQEVAEDVLQLLTQLSAKNAVAAILADGSACMPTLIGSSSSTVRKHAALGMVQAVAWHPQKALPLVHAGSIPPLLHLLNDADAETREAAAAAVGTLAASNVHVQAALVDAGVVTPLVDLLHKGLCSGLNSGSNMAPNVVLLDWAAYAIAHICKVSRQAQSRFYAAGALQPLVHLLRVPDAQQTAAYALGNLCANNDDIQRAAVAAGMAALLVTLLGEEHPPAVQKSAAAALGNVVAGNATEVSSALAAAGAVEQLISLLEMYSGNTRHSYRTNSSSLEVLEWAVYALGHLAKWPSGVQEMATTSSAVVLLIQLLGADTSPALQQNAACALANLAAGQPNVQGQIAVAGGIAALVQLLDSKHSFAVRRSAAAALWELVKHSPQNSMLLAATGGINPFVKMLACDEGTAEKLKVHEWARHFLQQLTDCSCQQVQAEMFAAGAILPLQQLAKESLLADSAGTFPAIDNNTIANCDHASRQHRQRKEVLVRAVSCTDVSAPETAECSALQHNHKQRPHKLWSNGASRWRFAGATSRLTHCQEQPVDQHLTCDSEGAATPATPDIVQSRSKASTHTDQRSYDQHRAHAIGKAAASASVQQQRQCNKGAVKSAGAMREPAWWRRSNKSENAVSTADAASGHNDVRRSADAHEFVHAQGFSTLCQQHCSKA